MAQHGLKKKLVVKTDLVCPTDHILIPVYLTQDLFSIRTFVVYIFSVK